MTTDKEHLQWIHNRIVEVYGESENVDFLIRMRKIIDKQETELNLHSVSGSFSDKDMLNGYCAGALETLTNKEATFLGYDHLNKIKKEAEEWKERYTNDR